MTEQASARPMLVFELVKKFQKNNMSGLELRSLKAENDNCRVVVNSPKTEQYADIKEKVAGYRDLTGHKMNFKGVGKSLEITATCENAMSVMMDFLTRLNFVNEDINDFVVFYNANVGFDSGEGCFGEVIFAEFGKDAGKIKLQRELPIEVCDGEEADAAADQKSDEGVDEEIFREESNKIYETMDPILTRYNIGVVKYLQNA